MANKESQVLVQASGLPSQPADAKLVVGPLRRLGALLYDTLLAIGIAAVTVAILMVVTFPFLPNARDHMLVTNEIGLLAYLYRIGAIVIVTLYIGVCWTRKGQTLGMQVWRIRIETLDGGLPSWRDCLLRMALATALWMVSVVVLAIAEQVASETLRWLGVGLLVLPFANYFAAAFDAQHRSWHDRFLRTRIVRKK